jgi:valacyclovir hydrolase
MGSVIRFYSPKEALTMPFAELKTGARLYYDDSGAPAEPHSSAPLVLVHGLLGTAALHFPRVTAWLSPHYRVIGVTLRGYGASTPKPRTFPVDFYHRDAADLLALLDALAIPRAHLLGYSDGGEVALIAAGSAPSRFASVMTIGAVGYMGPAMRPVAQRMYPGDWITDDELRLHGIPDRKAFVLGWINAVKSMIDAGGDVSLGSADKITAPLLLMLGDQDTLNPEAYGRRFVERTPDGRLQMFRCGHAIHDQAWDDFQRVVGAFLRGAD